MDKCPMEGFRLSESARGLHRPRAGLHAVAEHDTPGTGLTDCNLGRDSLKCEYKKNRTLFYRVRFFSN